MKTNSIILAFIACCLSTLALAQVEINKNLQMTGGTNADRLITNVGDASTSTGAVNVQSLQKGILIYAVTGGTANAVTATTTPSFAPQAGSTICFKATATNTGAVTLNVNGSGAVNLLRGNTALVAGDIQANQLVTATYDGTTWQATGGVGDNLGNHQATQTVTANANNAYDIGNSTNGFKDLYLTGSLKLDNGDFVSNLGGGTLLGNTQNTTNTGANNTFIGLEAGKNNTTASGSILIGYRAGSTQTTNGSNLFIGNEAGLNVTTSENIFIGNGASKLVTSGIRNVNIGFAVNNVATGSGTENILIGYNTASQTGGSNNVCIGSRALQLSSSGASDDNNVIIGAQACGIVISSKNNVIIGYQAGMGGASNYQNSVAIGYGTMVSQDNSVVFGSSTTPIRLGINTPTPRADIDVNATGAIIIPVGTTAQRPAMGIQGMIRFNTTTNRFEGYNGVAWVNLD